MRIFFVVLFLLNFCVPAFSNSPSDIVMNIAGTDLEILVQHPSRNTSEHFIKTIKIFLNEKEVASQNFTGQENEGQRAPFSLPDLKSGDKIKVWAECSVYGSLEKEFSAP